MELEKKIWEALGQVQDPDLNDDLVSLNMIKDLQVASNQVSFSVELTTPACPLKEEIKKACLNAIKLLVDKDLEVDIKMTSKVTAFRENPELLPNVKNIIAVASGKGGVGKSTVSVSLAVSLANSGAKVGLLDADIYGPSIPTLMGVKSAPELVDDKLIPVEQWGIKLMSIGFLVQPDQAVVWRGPMASSAIRQFVQDVDWGDLDYLIIDMPPGTGDIQLTIAQMIPLSGALMVTTPQKVAAEDCKKAMYMFNMPQINIPMLGLVENMSYLNGDDKQYIFGKGNSAALAAQFDVPFLGEIPLDTELCVQLDKGNNPWEKGFEAKSSIENITGELVRSLVKTARKQTVSQ